MDIADQYRIIIAGAGWADNTARGRLRFDGTDRASFLQALLTNEVAAIPPGAGTYALYLTPQGRMVADLRVFVGAEAIFADVPVELAASLAGKLDGLIFAEDVRVTDITQTSLECAVFGAGAPEVLGRAFGLDPGAVGDLTTWAHLPIDDGFVARTDEVAEGSWEIWTLGPSAPDVRMALEAAGAVKLSAELLEGLRIDAGRPRFGIDMTTETIPLEVGLLDRAISQTKGCYVGQEVIIRVLHRGGGRVAKRLVRLTCEGSDVPAIGDAVMADGAEVGRVTSAAWSPRVRSVVALAYVHRDAAEPGRAVEIAAASAVITGLAG
jgi:folate-binding protein YgfZ